MSNPGPTISVSVDLTNPGQFFACCGLLELADRLWPDSRVQGAFRDGFFQLWMDTTDCSLKRLIQQFVEAEVVELDIDDKAASPLRLGGCFGLRLDWWKRIELPDKTPVNLGGGDQLKSWAGKQFGPMIFRRMKSACVDIDVKAPFDDARAVYDNKNGKAKGKTISPFYFDSRREETSQDIGFSPDEQGMSVMAYPAVESLALVGLQRFRPIAIADESKARREFLYTAWSDPLPLSIAMAAASHFLPVRLCGTFRFTKPSRGGEYLTMFSRAKRERNDHV